MHALQAGIGTRLPFGSLWNQSIMNDPKDVVASPAQQPVPHSTSLRTTQKKSDVRSLSPSANDWENVSDLICFSHLRWNFVYQRPQHLLSRAARSWRVWYIEEPVWSHEPGLVIRSVAHNLCVVVPQLAHGTSPEAAISQQRALVDELIASQQIKNMALWYYTPMALLFSAHLQPRITIFDCMDELSAFMGAPPMLIEQEQQLMKRANVVFTGGYSLYEAKQQRHAHAYAFPSCIDYDHFVRARTPLPDPADQHPINYPRIGYSGVIDERLDLALIDELARNRPEWAFIFLGPVVKINPNDLPKRPNLHYLGMKGYDELPAYFSNWQAAMMPFSINEATRFISPTKTPEYMAAGLPVVSTPIRDVVRTYGSWDRMVIAESAQAFEAGLASVLGNKADNDRLALDQFLREQSWENTWQQMQRIINGHLQLVISEQ